MVLNATFNNSSAISWRAVLLVEETGEPVENHLPFKSRICKLELIDHETDEIGAQVKQIEGLFKYNYYNKNRSSKKSISNTARHDIAELLLNVALSTINKQTNKMAYRVSFLICQFIFILVPI
jgi:hypothetical protein